MVNLQTPCSGLFFIPPLPAKSGVSGGIGPMFCSEARHYSFWNTGSGNFLLWEAWLRLMLFEFYSASSVVCKDPCGRVRARARASRARAQGRETLETTLRPREELLFFCPELQFTWHPEKEAIASIVRQMPHKQHYRMQKKIYVIRESDYVTSS